MSIEIRFRAMKDDISNSEFVYGHLVYDGSGYPKINLVVNGISSTLFTTCLKGTEDQYVGLKDKNGKEIYKGDIVVCIINNNAIGANDEVGFKNGSFWLNRRNIPISEWYDKDNAEFEVIGNIYQP